MTTSIIEEDELLLDYQGQMFMNQPRKKALKKEQLNFARCVGGVLVYSSNTAAEPDAFSSYEYIQIVSI